MTVPVDPTASLADGHAALGRADWPAARAAFEASLVTPEPAEALEGLSRAAWWQGDEAATLDAREGAYRAYRAAGDVCGAARMAAWLGSDHIDFRGDEAVGAAWLRRARALLDGHPPCPELGWITLVEADLALLADFDAAAACDLAASALALAAELDDRGLEVVGAAILGSALVASGAVADGLRRLEQAAGLAVAEDFAESLAPGWALCHTVSVCAGLGDFDRASQWSRALRTFAETWSARHFFGVCRTAYGGVLTAHGDWPGAEHELTGAMEDLAAARPGLAGSTAVRLGELRTRQGRFDDARELFTAALPMPAALVGLGELDLLAGDPVDAAEAAGRALDRLPRGGDLDRMRPLELLARARLATDDAAGAAEAVAEVEDAAARLGTDYMRARAGLLAAEVRCATGEHDDGRAAAQHAVDLFTACSAPYEASRARLVLAGALSSLGRGDRAAAEAAAAHATMADLGAPATPRSGDASSLSARELEILRLIAGGLSNVQIAERLVLSPHTVHRHVAGLRAKLRVRSRSAAVAEAARAGLL